MNYFDLFEIQQKLDIDVEHVKSKYLILQQHQDLYSTDHHSKLNYTISLNGAYQTLIDALKRTEYFLSLHGITTYEPYRHRIDKTFLQKMIDKIELVDETNDSSVLEILLIDSNMEYQLIFSTMASSVDTAIMEGSVIQSDMLHIAVDGVIKLRYINTILSSIKQKIRALTLGC